LRAAFWVEEDTFPLGLDCKNAVEKVLKLTRAEGAKVAECRPDIDAEHLIDTYQRLLAPIIFSENPKPVLGFFRIIRPLLKMMSRGRRYTLTGTLSKAVQPEAEFRAAKVDRDAMKSECAKFFQQWDVLIAPVTATPAPRHNNSGLLFGRKIDVDGSEVSYLHQFDWIALATTCHLPAAVIPVTKSKQGLPIGIQIIGAQGEDLKVLRVARLIEQKIGLIG